MSFKVLLSVGVLMTIGTGAFLWNGTTKNTTTVPLVKLEVPTSVASPVARKDVRDVERLNIPSSQVVYIVGEIGINSYDIIKEIKNKAKTQDTLYLLIDSPGGSVLDGSLIISAMEASTATIHTVCTGLCASMAFVIHQYGDTRLAVDRSMLMAHPASGGLRGTLEQMESRLKTIIRFVDKQNAYIAKRIGVSLKDFKNSHVSELWLDAEDALEQKYVDEIVDVNTDATPQASMPVFGNETKDKLNITW